MIRGENNYPVWHKVTFTPESILYDMHCTLNFCKPIKGILRTLLNHRYSWSYFIRHYIIFFSLIANDMRVSLGDYIGWSNAK